MKQIPHQRSIFNSHSSSKGLSLKTIRRRKHQPSVNRWWRRYIASRSLVSSNRINAAFFVCVSVCLYLILKPMEIEHLVCQRHFCRRRSLWRMEQNVDAPHTEVSAESGCLFFFCTGVIRMDQRYIFFRVSPNTWITQTLFNSHLWGKTQALPDSFVKPNTGWQ